MKRIIYVLVCLLTVVTVVQAQTECENMLKAAEEYNKKGDYEKAASMYKLIQEDCGSNYGGSDSKLKDCNRKLKEDADYRKCTTIESCDSYLETYPQGRYVAKVQQKHAKLIRDKENARLRVEEEDAAFEDCITEKDCEEYLKKYPEGRYVAQVETRLEQLVKKRLMREEDETYANCTTESACAEYLADYPEGRYVARVETRLKQLVEERRMKEEDETYANCTTESACAKYLAEYPNGRYYTIVLTKKNTLAAERMRKEAEAKKTAYMKIRKIEFANVNKEGDVINSYGFTMYSTDIMYLMPRITYDGILDESKHVTLYCKIVNPDGSVVSNPDSPSDYTYSNSFWVQPGTGNTYILSCWGNSNGTGCSPGNHKLEIWYEGERIYQTSFIVKSKENALSCGNWRSALRKCSDYETHNYDNGSYKGQTSRGNRSGLGMCYCDGGAYYIGNWNLDGRNGRAIYMVEPDYIVSNCPDCVYYVGGWSNNDKSGTGRCYDKYGNLIYTGTFSNDKPAGSYPMSGYNNYKFECIEYSSGAYYVGETYKGKPVGQGVYIGSDGDMWYGEWRDGSRDGYGIYMPYQGSASTGIWKGDTKQ